MWHLDRVDFRVFRRVAGTIDWAEILWSPDTVVIRSLWGSWVARWSRPLSETSMVDLYAATGGRLEFDGDATAGAIRRVILERRRAGALSRDQARAEWSLVDEILDPGDWFADWFGATSLQGSASEFYRLGLPRAWRKFFDTVWPELVLALSTVPAGLVEPSTPTGASPSGSSS